MRRLLTIAAVALLPAGALGGCGADLGPVSPAKLGGTWITPNEVPGSSTVWTLSVNGTAVTGTGTWSGEACCGGTIAISGAVTNDEVILDVTVSTTTGAVLGPPVHYRFDGPIPMADTLQGVITYDDGRSGVTRLVRQ
jgi:hypothetical protein